MDDKELLAQAYRAAFHGAELSADRDMERHWNPLKNDGDALRLAVGLKIDIKHYDDHVVGWFDGGYIGTGNIMYEGDPSAATRRAIVRAAAMLAGK